MSNCSNIYKSARTAAGLTQDEASELLYISVRSVSDYEAGKTVPGDDVVCKMIEIYNSRMLAYLHLKYGTEVGKRFLPDISIADFPISVLRFQKEYQDVNKIHNDMIEIACDGKINDYERSRWQAVRKEISEIASAAIALMFIK